MTMPSIAAGRMSRTVIRVSHMALPVLLGLLAACPVMKSACATELAPSGASVPLATAPDDAERDELAYHSRWYRGLKFKARSLRLTDEQTRRIAELEQSTLDSLRWLRQLHAAELTVPSVPAELPVLAQQRAKLIEHLDEVLASQVLDQRQLSILTWGC